VGFAWIFFRAANLDDAWIMVSGSTHITSLDTEKLLNVKTDSILFGRVTLLFIALSLSYMFITEKMTNAVLTNLNTRKITDILIFTMTLLLIIFFGVFHRTSFIYFQF
jgi:hypothetical protein